MSYRVQHLLLVEPWGFVSKPEVDLSPITQYKRFKLVSAFAGSFNLFSPVRAIGPLGKQYSGLVIVLEHIFNYYSACGACIKLELEL